MKRILELSGATLMLTVAQATAMAPQGAGGEQGSPLGLFVPLILMFVVLYLFMIRPAQKKQKEKDRMISALKKGDRIVTSGGIYGEITQVKDNSVIVRIDDNVKVELQRPSVSSVLNDGGEDESK